MRKNLEFEVILQVLAWATDAWAHPELQPRGVVQALGSGARLCVYFLTLVLPSYVSFINYHHSTLQFSSLVKCC